jgi:hypothetical protein
MTSKGASVKTHPRKWVLVVDDNARLRALWVEVLEEVGYRVVGRRTVGRRRTSSGISSWT